MSLSPTADVEPAVIVLLLTAKEFFARACPFTATLFTQPAMRQQEGVPHRCAAQLYWAQIYPPCPQTHWAHRAGRWQVYKTCTAAGCPPAGWLSCL